MASLASASPVRLHAVRSVSMQGWRVSDVSG